MTFDDGFACLLENAFPVMRSLGIPCTVFPVTGNLGDRPRWCMPAGHPEAAERLMTAEEVRAAQDSGMCRIGSHTLTHPRLGDLKDPETLRREIEESRAALETITGSVVEDLALPHGSCTPATLAAARAAGYRRIFTLGERLWSGRAEDDVIGRFPMSPDVWKLEFLLTCEGAYSYLYHWRRCLRRAGSWIYGGDGSKTNP